MLEVLYNEAKVRMMCSKRQRLRADATSNIDNQRALGKLFPGVSCHSETAGSDVGPQICKT
jgi:hypothetical protein